MIWTGKQLASCISRTCCAVCAGWGTDTTKRANLIWRRKFPGRRCAKVIPTRRLDWTWRDLRLNWISMGWKCRRWWIRYLPGLLFHTETAAGCTITYRLAPCVRRNAHFGRVFMRTMPSFERRAALVNAFLAYTHSL